MASSTRPPPFPEIELAGVRLHQPTERECVEFILRESLSGRGGWVVTPNLDILRRCSLSPALRRLVHEADLRVADGMPLIWAGRFAGRPFPERVPGSGLIHSVTRAAAEHGLAIYFLGGDPGTGPEAARRLAKEYPGWTLAGHHCPAPGFERDPARMGEIAARLRASSADIVFAALGFPKQELVIRVLRESLPAAWWLGVGISFSFVAERVRRAPLVLQRLGLEWAHRLAQEPGRLARRYLLEDLPFALHFLLHAFVTRPGRRGI